MAALSTGAVQDAQCALLLIVELCSLSWSSVHVAVPQVQGAFCLRTRRNSDSIPRHRVYGYAEPFCCCDGRGAAVRCYFYLKMLQFLLLPRLLLL